MSIGNFPLSSNVKTNNKTTKLTIIAATLASLSAPAMAQFDANSTTVNAPIDAVVDTGSTTGTAGYAAKASNNGQLIADGAISLMTGGNSAHGLAVTTNGVVRFNTEAFISTKGTSANGINIMTNGGDVTANDITIITEGKTAKGIYAYSVGAPNPMAQVHFTGNSNITTYGEDAYGAWGAGAITKFTFNNININTSGLRGYALNAQTGAIINAKRATIFTTGDVGYGAAADGGGKITFGAGSQIHTQGLQAHGLWSVNQGTLIEATDTSIITSGMGASAVHAQSGGVITAERVAITTTGDAAYGAIANAGSTITFGAGSQIQTQGLQAHGLWAVDQDSQIEATDTSIITSGIGASTVLATSQGAVTFNQHSGQLISLQGTNFDASGGTINAVLDGSTVQNSGLLIGSYAQGEVNLNASNLVMQGDVFVDQLSTANLSLNQAAWTGRATNGTNFKLDGSSIWNMIATSDVANLDHAGQINFTIPAGDNFKTLTVHNNYDGKGGAIALHSKLNSDDSPTDQLIVTGDTSGNTKLHISNAGGVGALTLADGIKVVDVTGASNGSFGLASRVSAGLYEYDLFQGGVDAHTADGNWYLRSLKLDDGTSVIPTETTVYLRNLNAASTMFMHTLHDRLGEPQFTDAYKTEDNKPSSVWVRVVSNHTDSTGGNGQIDLNTDTSLVHLGADIARWSNNGADRWNIGVMGAYGHSKIDASPNQLGVTPSGFKRNTSGKVDGYSVGGYATWYGNKDKPEGAYVDTWAQFGWYDNKVQGNTKAEESYNSNGWTASVETGYAMIARDEGKNRQLMFEPQIQVAYNRFSSDDHIDASGTRITDNNANGVITRVGARLYSRSTQNDNGIQPFVEANWWYSDAKNSLAFNGETMSDGTPNSRYELKAGLQGEVAKNWLMWGHAGVQFGQNDFNRYEGMVGLKRMF